MLYLFFLYREKGFKFLEKLKWHSFSLNKSNKNQPTSMASSFKIDQDLSLYIPVVFKNLDSVYIKEAVESMGYGAVKRVDLINRNDKDRNIAYVHFEKWTENGVVERFQERVKNGGARIVYSDPSYWLVCENKSQQSSFKINQKLSIYIPVVFKYLDAAFVKDVFELLDYGVVKKVDLVVKREQNYNVAYVHFRKWNESRMVERFQESILNDGSARVVYNDPTYWIVCENTGDPRTPGDRKKVINVDDLYEEGEIPEYDYEQEDECEEEAYDHVSRDYIDLLESNISELRERKSLAPYEGFESFTGDLVDSSYAHKLELVLAQERGVVC